MLGIERGAVGSGSILTIVLCCPRYKYSTINPFVPDSRFAQLLGFLGSISLAVVTFCLIKALMFS